MVNAKADCSHAEGSGTVTKGSYSHAEGGGTYAIGSCSHAEGEHTTASGNYSHAEGQSTSRTIVLTGEANTCMYVIADSDPATIRAVSVGKVLEYGNVYAIITDFDPDTLTIKTDKTLSSSTALSAETRAWLKAGIAYGEGSHSEGCGATASGNYSHAEGGSTIASGYASHAEGDDTSATGYCSHTEGQSTKASGYASHAEGYMTTARGDYSHVQGKYNVEDTENKYAHIVGNGKVTWVNSVDKIINYSNAHTLDWAGNAWFAGSAEATALILSSPNGTRFKITVDDSGTLSTTRIYT